MRKIVLVLVMIAALAVPASAAASDGYTNIAGVDQGGGSSGTPSAVSTESTPTAAVPAAVATAGESGSENMLPFTGLDLGLMLAAGGLLLGTGFVLRRLQAHNS